MLNLELPTSEENGERARAAIVDTAAAIASLPRGEDSYLSDENATFNEGAKGVIEAYLHEQGLVPSDIRITGAKIGFSDLRRGWSDDCAMSTLTFTTELPELEERRQVGLPTGSFLMIALHGGANYYSSPQFSVGTVFAGDIERDHYGSDLRELVEPRLKGITEALEEYRRNDEGRIVSLFDIAKEQLLAGNATPDRRAYPYKIPWMGLDPDDFPFGLP